MKKLLTLVVFLMISSAFSATKSFVDRFPFKYHLENVTVYSDISEEFSRTHAEHCLKVWKYYSKLFAKTPGKSIELFYTKNQTLYNAILKRYPTIVLKGARQVTANWTGDHRQWFIMPYTEPDFGTQLHEISHDFLYHTYPGCDAYPWFREGSAMYFESGRMDDAGNLVVEKPFESLKVMFDNWRDKNRLIPLKRLVSMPQKEYYRGEFYKQYSQSMMLYFYLMKKHPAVMDRLLGEINRGRIKHNSQIINFIIKNTGMDLMKLEKEYARP